MMILTPSGYRDIATCAVGDEVSAFDVATGAPIVNTIETLQWIDAATYRDWQNPLFLINGQEHFALHSLYVLCPPKNAPQPVQVRDLAVGNEVFRIEGGDYVFDFEITSILQVEPYPAFQFFRINGTWVLNSEQSIWRNGLNVCHAKHLIVGDIVHDDADHDVTITRIEEVTADGWWRFDISGDHSYIVDGLTLHNASRFWVGGSASWTAANTTPWASSSGGAGGQSVPTSSDAVTFDASSGGGTATLNFGGTITVQSITSAAYTGTFDNSVNNNNITLSGTTGFSSSGSGVRAIKLGTATYTLTTTSASATPWQFTVTTNLTLTAGSETIVFSGATQNLRIVAAASKSWGTLTLNASTGPVQIAGTTPTFAAINLNAGTNLYVNTGTSLTLTTFNWSGTGASASQVLIASWTIGSQASIITSAGTPTMVWLGLRDIIFSGGATFTATNSFDLGNNTGGTITPPSPAGGGAGFNGYIT